MSNNIVNIHMEAIRKFVEIASVNSYPEVQGAIRNMVNNSLEEIGKEFTCLEERLHETNEICKDIEEAVNDN